MSNMIQAAREQVAALTQAAYEKAAAEACCPPARRGQGHHRDSCDVTTGITPPPSPWPGPRPCARPPMNRRGDRQPSGSGWDLLTRWRSPAPAS